MHKLIDADNMASVQLVNTHQPLHTNHYHPPHDFQLLCQDSSAVQILDYTTMGYVERSPKYLSSPVSSAESDGQNRSTLKKNKRKLSEPKRRSDLIIKNFIPHKIKVCSLKSENKDIKNDNNKKLKHIKSRKLSSSDNVISNSTLEETQRLSPTCTAENEDRNDQVSNFNPPDFHTSPPTMRYLPSLYFSGVPYSTTSLQASFSALPIHMQQAYFAASVAIPDQTSSLLSSNTADVNAAASLQCKELRMDEVHQTNTNQTTCSTTSSSAITQSPINTSRSNIKENQEDDDDALSAQSPEEIRSSGKFSRKHRKNYKNMTRERRVEANARERTRVHTISAAFDALRHAVPSYSHNQKLSKLAILRIACSYIMSLARLADLDYTSTCEHIGTPLTFAQCVDLCTNTIQTEGRARRRH